MKHNFYTLRGRYMALFALLFLAIFGPNRVMAAEVDTVWTSDYGNTIQFQHPVTKDLIFVELSFDIGKLITMDSKNGKIIKEVPFKNDWNNKSYISPDGTKLLHTNGDNTDIYEYPNMQLITTLELCRLSKFINNDEVISETGANSFLVKYNIKTKEKQVFLPEGSVKSIATSPDGRFIAYSISSVGNQQNWSKLILMDAKTMKDITVIDEVSYNEYNFGNVNFSTDGKYLTYKGKVIEGQRYIYIFNTEINKNIQVIKPVDYNSTLGYMNFLSNNLYTVQFDDGTNHNSKTILFDINTNKIILIINNGVASPILNDTLKHLYYREGLDGKNYCLNITNLITGVSPTQPITFVKYQNKELIINKENVRKVEVTDISGRLIMNKIIENPFTNNTILPINLANGAYLINITTDNESFTNKLLVME